MLEMTTGLLLVRHGAIDPRGVMEGHTATPLNEVGRRQAALLARRLCRDRAVAAVYWSPLLRARQTAAAVLECMSTTPDPARACPALAEIDCGEFNGVPLETVRHRAVRIWAANERHDDDRFCWPGGESYRQLRARVLWGLRHVARVHRGQQVLLVTHAGVVSQVVGWLHGLSAARWDAFRPRPASVTELTVRARAWELVSFNDTSHLTGMP
jgi:2,3-bisphosphoglycerate-dependent phosphoglycerate mutase